MDKINVGKEFFFSSVWKFCGHYMIKLVHITKCLSTHFIYHCINTWWISEKYEGPVLPNAAASALVHAGRKMDSDRYISSEKN